MKATIHSREHADLFLRTLRGDHVAFHELYRFFTPRLERYVRRQLGANAPIDDLLQEIWERVIKLGKRPQKDFEAEHFQVQAFLFRIAHNLVIDYVRTRKSHEPLDSVSEFPGPVGTITDAEELVVKAMERLSFDFKEVLILHLHMGYRLDEIAVMLDKSPDAIWARASRARAKLRKIVVELAEKEGVSLSEFKKDREIKQEHAA